MIRPTTVTLRDLIDSGAVPSCEICRDPDYHGWCAVCDGFDSNKYVGPYIEELIAACELGYADAESGDAKTIGHYALFVDYTATTGETIHAILTTYPNGVTYSCLYPAAVMAQSSFNFLTETRGP